MTGALPQRVTLREVGPRDELQNVSAFVATDKKVEIIRRVAEAGVREIEVTSFVSDKVIPQMADAEAVMRRLAGDRSMRSVLLATPKRAEQAIAEVADQLVVFLSASEVHNHVNVNRSIAESLAGIGIERLIAAARYLEEVLAVQLPGQVMKSGPVAWNGAAVRPAERPSASLEQRHR